MPAKKLSGYVGDYDWFRMLERLLDAYPGEYGPTLERYADAGADERLLTRFVIDKSEELMNRALAEADDPILEVLAEAGIDAVQADFKKTASVFVRNYLDARAPNRSRSVKGKAPSKRKAPAGKTKGARR